VLLLTLRTCCMAKRDDGLMIGSVHPQQTLELLVEMIRNGYDSAIYFDTFPDLSGLDPVAEATTNVTVVQRLIAIAEQLANDDSLRQAIDSQNAPVSQKLVSGALFGQMPTT